MASEWPNIVWLSMNQAHADSADQYSWDEDDEPFSHGANHGRIGIYLHRDAARAWQAFRDFLNGTADQWIKKVSHAEHRGYNEGWKDGRS